MPKVAGRKSTRPEYDLLELAVSSFFINGRGKYRCCVRGCGRVFQPWEASPSGRQGAVVAFDDADRGLDPVGEICPEHVEQLLDIRDREYIETWGKDGSGAD